MAFKQSSATRKPTLACVGYVKEVGAMKRGKEGSPYITIPIKIANASQYRGRPGMDISVNLSFLPEFFAADFDPDTIGPDTFGAKHRGAKWSYEKNLISPKGQCGAMLQCMAGDADGFTRLGAVIDGLPDLQPETIYDALVNFFEETGQVLFGYILRQPDKKTDEVGPDGKPVYELSAYYEVDTFFRVSKESVEKLVKRLEKNQETRATDPTKEKFELRFDPEIAEG